MEDHKIIDLYWARSQQAIVESDQKYGPYCRAIALGILAMREDAEECVNDTWHRAWNTMPPQRPASLRAYLVRLVRNLSIDRWRARKSQKRGEGLEALVLELEDCHRLDCALDLAQNLHCYNFLPRNMELADYGKMLAKQDGIYPMDELLVSCFDAEGYANQKMRNLGLSAAEHGYVSWNGIEILYEYSQPPNNPTMSM